MRKMFKFICSKTSNLYAKRENMHLTGVCVHTGQTFFKNKATVYNPQKKEEHKNGKS